MQDLRLTLRRPIAFLMKKKFNVIENLQSQIVVADLCMSESTC